MTIAFAIRGPVARGDLPGLCDRVCALLEGSRNATVICDVYGVRADAVAVDALARLQLAARRRGCQVRLRGASPELARLVAFMGLADVLAGGGGPVTPPEGGAEARTAGRATPYPGRS